MKRWLGIVSGFLALTAGSLPAPARVNFFSTHLRSVHAKGFRLDLGVSFDGGLEFDRALQPEARLNFGLPRLYIGWALTQRFDLLAVLGMGLTISPTTPVEAHGQFVSGIAANFWLRQKWFLHGELTYFLAFGPAPKTAVSSQGIQTELSLYYAFSPEASVGVGPRVTLHGPGLTRRTIWICFGFTIHIR